MRMRNINRDQRDARSRDLVPDHRRNLLLHLKLDHQVHLVPDKLLCILQRRRRVIAVVQNQQIHPHRSRRILQTLRHLDRERHIRALPTKPKPQLLRPRHLPIQPIRRLRKIPPMHKRLQHPVHRRLRDPRLPVNRLQRQRLVLRLQQLKNIQRLRQHRNQIKSLRRLPNRHSLLSRNPIQEHSLNRSIMRQSARVSLMKLGFKKNPQEQFTIIALRYE